MSDNNYIRYVIFLNHITDRDFTENVVKAHVSHLKKLEQNGQLFLCGPFKDYKGGMIIINVDSYEEAKAIAEADPFVKEGFESYELRTLEMSCKENNHLGMG